MAVSVACRVCGRSFQTADVRQGNSPTCPACLQAVEAADTGVHSHDVFISYSHKDKQISDAVCTALEIKGIQCWMAPRDVPSGETWGASIVDAIGRSRVMVLIFSANSNESKQVLREIERAVSKKLKLVVLRIDDAPLSKDFEYFLSASQWLRSGTQSTDKILGELTSQVMSLLKNKPTSRRHASSRIMTSTRMRSLLSRIDVRRIARIGLIVILVGLTAGTAIWALINYSGREDGAKTTADVTAEPDAEILDDPGETESESATKIDDGFWTHSAYEARLRLDERTTMEFVWIDAGRFNMGSPPAEKGRHGNETYHPVRLTSGFWLADHEVTQAQWMAVMGSDNNPSTFTGTTHPVEGVTWFDCYKFLRRLKKLTGEDFRLPTEAEWEYACKAQSDSVTGRNSEDGLGKYAWYRANSSGETNAVRQKLPNAWGLYDMHGNVAEICADRYAPYPSRSVTDPIGPQQRANVVVRGGSWESAPVDLRSAKRGSVNPQTSNEKIGFRIGRW